MKKLAEISPLARASVIYWQTKAQTLSPDAFCAEFVRILMLNGSALPDLLVEGGYPQAQHDMLKLYSALRNGGPK